MTETGQEQDASPELQVKVKVFDHNWLRVNLRRYSFTVFPLS
jgi:hypothetical protein